MAHKETGYLAQPFEVQDLAKGIAWVLEKQKLNDVLSQQSRSRAVKLFSPQVAGKKYLDMYQQALR